ncbi:hypothetical protein [Streptomyces alboflavus]|uniref:Uncharacterized protein n=1 Tax=Streptomyces alboflavus TaxID=67267 RepID=A0A1Z1W3G0_9ACTN|nr:hypothetical protein [Streptomyces alboflavus]ARX80963.1 hypothetical protein SMD44_00361 [Streptomyces alboflavus]
MFRKLEGLGSRMLDRLVPTVEASAAEAACTCRQCVQGGPTSGCASTGHRWYRKRPCGGGPWIFDRCANCTPGSGTCA